MNRSHESACLSPLVAWLLLAGCIVAPAATTPPLEPDKPVITSQLYQLIKAGKLIVEIEADPLYDKVEIELL